VGISAIITRRHEFAKLCAPNSRQRPLRDGGEGDEREITVGERDLRVFRVGFFDGDLSCTAVTRSALWKRHEDNTGETHDHGHCHT
jgi:hypothetical protein